MKGGYTRIGPIRVTARHLRVIIMLLLILGLASAALGLYFQITAPKLEVLQSTYTRPSPTEIQFRVVVQNSGTITGSGILVCVYEFRLDSVTFLERLNITLDPDERKEYIIVVKLGPEFAMKVGVPDCYLEE